MKPLFVLAFIFVTAIAFAQNEPREAGQTCQQIVTLEARMKDSLKFTDPHAAIVFLREQIARLRAELQKDSPGYVCKSQDQGAGIIGHQPNVTQRNVTQPNIRQPNVRSFECNPVAQRLEREVRVLRDEIASMLERYTENHPDVQRARVQLASAEVQLAGENCSATGEPSSVCDTIEVLHAAREPLQKHLAQQQLGDLETDPDEQAKRAFLASLEVNLTAARARAASHGIDCSATNTTTRETQHP